MIEATGLVKTYHDGDTIVKPLQNTEFICTDGEFVLITGRSGTGKTTFLNAIGGLTRPDAGRVKIDGVDLLEHTDKENAVLRSRTIGFVFQFPGLLSALTVLENVLLPAEIAGLSIDRERGCELLRKVGLSDKESRSPAQLSGGELKRTAIARSLINSPNLILADEPTGDLDAETEQEIMELFAGINRMGTTIIMVTHNTELARYATRVLRMEDGLLYQG